MQSCTLSVQNITELMHKVGNKTKVEGQLAHENRALLNIFALYIIPRVDTSLPSLTQLEIYDDNSSVYALPLPFHELIGIKPNAISTRIEIYLLPIKIQMNVCKRKCHRNHRFRLSITVSTRLFHTVRVTTLCDLQAAVHRPTSDAQTNQHINRFDNLRLVDKFT